ncbi:hypothetical protein P7K49_012183 [Saguinus oedipus]|uniref:Secreted and transmembrane protein 1 n=1 Tax=Saguinus oedipus TaxID=9490 RepID=A0ABQ9VSR1_SAGOE|nr:hypothetical protein P7K49_012183 [Saguinus oedipus]
MDVYIPWPWAQQPANALRPSPDPRWDVPTCTEGVVSVSQGTNVAMSCNISNTFSLVTITLRRLRENKTIFHNVSQGCFSQNDWQLWVQGGMAQLLIKGVQDSHAGLYMWHLRGHQRNNRYITLEVSEGSRSPTNNTDYKASAPQRSPVCLSGRGGFVKQEGSQGNPPPPPPWLCGETAPQMPVL